MEIDRVPAVVVTGAAKGIGEAVARLLVERNQLVIGMDRDQAGLADVGDQLSNEFVGIAGM
ncbi:MAG: SDR family NAD(P)-dependent oxidoreductase [Microlunatus sp.]|nr:SDR family NAD(P)-dependent oxidoreductase [Microlunatus sp.]